LSESIVEISAVLSTHGYTVVTTDSGEAALTLLASHTFDVVLTDLQLPGLRGYDLANALRSTLISTTRLLGMSGSEPSDRERSAFDAFLLKPFTAEQFTQAAKAGVTSAPASRPSTAGSGVPVLDEAIVTRLAKQLPPAKLKELFQLTLSDARMRIGLMQQALSAGDLDTVRREAHAIKGGTGMVGATELHHMAAQAERDASAGSAQDTPPIEDFLAACVRLERMLDTRFSS